MPTTLCLDFGNTRLKAAVFANDQLSEIIHLRHESIVHITQIINQYQPRCSILSSVINHLPEIEILLAAKTDFHKLSHLSKLPFSIPVGKPETVGTDRLAIAAGAVHFYPHKNNLIIALGSCITYNFINSAHELIGGSISPGTEIRFKSLNDYTAKLPLVKGNWNVPLIGYDTLTNIQSGVILGMAKEIDGIVDSYNEKFGNFNAVLTGGDLPFIAPHIKREIFADPEILFKGLYAISQINHA
ncbi:MAG: type III pantothenate kinase [Chitinophagaceae bacterium]